MSKRKLRTKDGTPVMAIELFPCSGGMAEGFRRAGVTFQWAFDYSKDACNSYEKNLGHRPVHMDVNDLLRLVRGGWRPMPEIDLLVADPPCTPWSRAGKRRGVDDPRDMLRATVEVIKLLKPHAYLIGNVPGLDDAKSWHHVQRELGHLHKEGYCVLDYLTLDAADYGVPQHRVRPFWFGHLDGPCLMPPERTHGDPVELARALPIPGVRALKPWVTCREALGHLEPHELGRPVKLRYRGCNSHQHGSVPDRPARVVGTSNLSDGNVLLPFDQAEEPKRGRQTRQPGRQARASTLDEPAHVLTTRDQSGDGGILITDETQRYQTARPRTKDRGVITSHKANHQLRGFDRPAATLTKNTHSDGAMLILDDEDDALRARTPAEGHAPHEADKPARTVRAASRGQEALLTHPRHPVSDADSPSHTVTTKGDGRGAQGACVVKATPEWPWPRPSTTVTTRAGLAPPGHHPESGSVLSQPGAVVLSEKAAMILQGFPDGWVLDGKTKRARWEMLGMAMPPGLAEAVGRAIVKARGWK